MTNSSNGFFPGVFDSDGRPWESWQRVLKLNKHRVHQVYKKAQLDALKVGLLTQSELILPIGYIFDSPFLQDIFLDIGSRTDNEAVAFRRLMREHVRVAHGATSGYEVVKEWKLRFSDWALGKTTKRNQLVYMNALPHDTAIALQKEAQNLIQKVEVAMREKRKGFNYPQFLDFCENIEFRSISEGPFDFDELFRKHVLSQGPDREQFPVLTSATRTKLESIAEVTKREGKRLSRSLINNPEQCLALGATPLERTEYEQISDVLAHYHHMAFARSFGLGLVSTRTIPTLADRSQRQLQEALHRAIYKLGVNGKVPRFPLESVSFSHILLARTGKNSVAFNEGLRRIVAATEQDDLNEYVDAVREHATRVLVDMSLPFGYAAIDELVAAGSKMIFPNRENIEKAARDTAPRVVHLLEKATGPRSGFVARQYLRRLA